MTHRIRLSTHRGEGASPGVIGYYAVLFGCSKNRDLYVQVTVDPVAVLPPRPIYVGNRGLWAAREYAVAAEGWPRTGEAP